MEYTILSGFSHFVTNEKWNTKINITLQNILFVYLFKCRSLTAKVLSEILPNHMYLSIYLNVSYGIQLFAQNPDVNTNRLEELLTFKHVAILYYWIRPQEKLFRW